MAMLKLSRSDLARLKELVEQMQPMSPSQALALFDVVTHVYLVSEPYDHLEIGFLGMGMAPLYGLNGDEDSGGGVIVQSRMPGLAAYSALLEGDVILRIAEHPEMELNNSARVVAIVKQYKPGDTLHMVIRRQGRQMTVSVSLSARPVEAILMDIESFNEGRMRNAMQFWNENFGPLVKPMYSQAD